MFLEINNLKKSFGTGESRVEVLKGIQFSVEKGEICVLLGPSGSGKSTLLNIIGGIDEADSGSIVIEGEKIEDMNEKTLTRYRRKHLGYVFQMYNPDSKPDGERKYGSRRILKQSSARHQQSVKDTGAL